MAADPHAVAAELAYARQLVRGNGNGSDLVPASSPRGQEPKPAKREARRDTPQLDEAAWNSWCDQRADARIEAALAQRENIMLEVMGQALGSERQRARAEVSKAVDAATKEFRAEIAALRSELGAMGKELQAQRALVALYRENAQRDVALNDVRHDLKQLVERVGPLVEHYDRYR
jgi:hypothetical protein